MKLTSFFTAIGAASAVALPGSLQKRECHGSGETWGAEKFLALQTAQENCNGIINGPFTTGGQYIRKCVNLSSTKKIDFFLRYNTDIPTDRPARAIDNNLCTEYFHREINGCDHGGRSSYPGTAGGTGALTVSADPNEGNCA
ncbi:hypothetical protein Focb16_v016371 [Fusarium oxysporum f. sp. cubense]|uniref:Uncharacterized protein n=1 Tax=Fusarium oxysporum f. sp. cubense TaxID=61366 RepID=A0A559KWE9_FUSOC|nr:hypothetical protein Focb16_v016371 [Fusarium oxysporum f. sp. cubense]